jgi:hypothetical protein
MIEIFLVSTQVLSLDISEFSPDAEDTRSNMLLPQLFYQFALGVASRPSASKAGSRRAPGTSAGVEVDSHVGSFLLPDHGHFVPPPRIQTERHHEMVRCWLQSKLSVLSVP